MFKEKDRVAVFQPNGKTREWLWGGERIYTVKTTTPYVTLWDVPNTYCNSEGVIIRTKSLDLRVGDKLEFRYSHPTDLCKYLQTYLVDGDTKALEFGLSELDYNGLVGGENTLVKRIKEALQNEDSQVVILELFSSYYSPVFPR